MCSSETTELLRHGRVCSLPPLGCVPGRCLRCPGPFSSPSGHPADQPSRSCFQRVDCRSAGCACRQPRRMRRQAARRAHPCRTPSCLRRPCLSKTRSCTPLATAAAQQQHPQKVQPAAGTETQVRLHPSGHRVHAAGCRHLPCMHVALTSPCAAVRSWRCPAEPATVRYALLAAGAERKRVRQAHAKLQHASGDALSALNALCAFLAVPPQAADTFCRCGRH